MRGRGRSSGDSVRPGPQVNYSGYRLSGVRCQDKHCYSQCFVMIDLRFV